MAGLVPAIHVLLSHGTKDVDARHKAGHDDFLVRSDRERTDGDDVAIGV
jgi:hypothetical protein